MTPTLRAVLVPALFAGLLSTAALALPAAAQDEAPAAEPAAPEMPDAFAKAERLEALRYRHLWIAYGAIWLIVFVFVFRTWRSSTALSTELDGLKSRLAELEARDDRG